MRLSSRERFYLAADGEPGDKVHISGETSEGYDTIEAALAAITSDLESHGGVAFIYECVPIKRVTSCRVTVEDIQRSAEVK